MNRPRVVYFPSGVLVYFSSGATTCRPQGQGAWFGPLAMTVQPASCRSTVVTVNSGDRGNNFDAPDVIDWDLHLPRGGESIPLPVGQIDDGIRHEGKRPAAHRCLNEARADIEDPIGETVRRSGCAVVDLVGMQDVALAGQAMPRLAAVMKGLDASERDVRSRRYRGDAVQACPRNRFGCSMPSHPRPIGMRARLSIAGRAPHNPSRRSLGRRDSVACMSIDAKRDWADELTCFSALAVAAETLALEAGAPRLCWGLDDG